MNLIPLSPEVKPVNEVNIDELLKELPKKRYGSEIIMQDLERLPDDWREKHREEVISLIQEGFKNDGWNAYEEAVRKLLEGKIKNEPK